jgi:hypothetical protein
MNIHTPERQPDEDKKMYHARLKASREQTRRATHPRGPMDAEQALLDRLPPARGYLPMALRRLIDKFRR